jgi:predicted aspartyl protease
VPLTLRIFAVFIALLVSLRHASAATEIPCEFRQGLIWLKVSVPGQPSVLNFLLDSGAGVSVLDLTAAQRIGAKLGSSQPVQGVGSRGVGYRVNGFTGELAGVALSSKVLALDLSSVSQGCGRRIDGLIGADFFRNRIVQIDFARQKVRLLGRDEFRGAGCEVLPLAARGDALCIRVGVAGNAPEWMRVDTGCDVALRWVAAAGKASKLAQTSVAVTTGTRGSVRADVQLGSVRVPGVQTAIHAEQIFPGEAGLLGNGLLSKFVVTFDAAKKQLLLGRN